MDGTFLKLILLAAVQKNPRVNNIWAWMFSRWQFHELVLASRPLLSCWLMKTCTWNRFIDKAYAWFHVPHQGCSKLEQNSHESDPFTTRIGEKHTQQLAWLSDTRGNFRTRLHQTPSKPGISSDGWPKYNLLNIPSAHSLWQLDNIIKLHISTWKPKDP